jgi:hypothetical protein
MLLIAALGQSFSRKRLLPRGYLVFQAIWLSATAFHATAAVWAALPVHLWLSRVPFRGWTGWFAILLWSSLWVTAGLLIPWEVGALHTRGGPAPGAPVFYLVLVGIPLLIGMRFRPLSEGHAITQGLLLALIAAATLPGPGVYYYGVNQNILRVLLPAVLIVLLIETKRDRWLLAAVCPSLLFIQVSAGGWDWSFGLHLMLHAWPPALHYGLAVAALGGAGLIWARHAQRPAWLGMAALLMNGWLLAGFFEYESNRIVGFALILLSLSAALKLLETDAKPALRTAWQVAIITGFAFVLMWSATDGFYMKNLRMEFALRRLQTVYNDEAALASAVTGLMAVRYLLVAILVVFAAGLTLGAKRLSQLAPWVILVGAVRLVAQSLQIAGVQFVELEKSSELLIQESLGVAVVTALIWMALLVVEGIRGAFGRPPSTPTDKAGPSAV